MREQVLMQARDADQAVSRGQKLGAFHGVPVCVKESFGVKGQPDTWGIPALKNSKASENAVAVDCLLNAGAVLIGGTNVPTHLMDVEGSNEVYGTTNNPWDLSRTPGGSSGGSAAALAAGLACLSVGSDIGGSLREPAGFCGIYSHKPCDLPLSLRWLPWIARAKLQPAWPAGYSLQDSNDSYRFLLSAFLFSVESKESQERDRKRHQQDTSPFATGALSSYAEWQQQHLNQLRSRALWQEYFEKIDVFLMPCSFTVAIHHDHREDKITRFIDTPDGRRPYAQLGPWMVTASLTGCPATATPIGRTRAGLPVGIQIMVPFCEDATPIQFAHLLGPQIGGFQPSPGFEA